MVLDLTNFTVATSCICHQMSFQLKPSSFHGHQSTLSMVFSLASLIVPVWRGKTCKNIFWINKSFKFCRDDTTERKNLWRARVISTTTATAYSVYKSLTLTGAFIESCRLPFECHGWSKQVQWQWQWFSCNCLLWSWQDNLSSLFMWPANKLVRACYSNMFGKNKGQEYCDNSNASLWFA